MDSTAAANDVNVDVDVRALSDSELLDHIHTEYCELSRQQARVFAAMAELGKRDPMGCEGDGDMPYPGAADEIRAELRLSRQHASGEIALAWRLVHELPEVFAALRDGRIDRTKARVFADQTYELTAAQARSVCQSLLPKAAQWTASEIGSRIRRLAIALDPSWAERRYRAAVRGRRVVGTIGEDGSATITGSGLDATAAGAACARIDGLARSVKNAGCESGLDAIRADLYLGFLDGALNGLSRDEIIAHFVATNPPNPVSGTESPTGVELRVELSTLMGHDEHPAEIAGLGMVTASVARATARRQARGSEWRFAVLDADGHLVFDGVTRRRPRHWRDRSDGGVIELHVPESTLADATASREWSAVVTDIAHQFRLGKRAPQDPTARFAGAALRRHIQIRDRTCTFPGVRHEAPVDRVGVRDHHRCLVAAGRS